MTKLSLPYVETERLILRPFVAADLDEWARCIFDDPEVMRYLPKRNISPREHAERNFVAMNEEWGHFGYTWWAVTEKLTGRLMGHCGLSNNGVYPGEIELTYALAKADWGKGIATEAARASVRFGFETIQLERVFATAIPENIGSRRVMEHIGFVYEKDAQYLGYDVVYYALKRGEFRADNSFYRLQESQFELDDRPNQ